MDFIVIAASKTRIYSISKAARDIVKSRYYHIRV